MSEWREMCHIYYKNQFAELAPFEIEYRDALLLALVFVELQNTCEKIEQKNAWKTQHMLYF